MEPLDDWKSFAWSDSTLFLLQRSDGRVRNWPVSTISSFFKHHGLAECCFWDVMEQEIQILDVQPINLQNCVNMNQNL